MRLVFTATALWLTGLALTGCVAGSGVRQAPSPEGVVSGSVAYRERIGLPPDAVVEVKLSDVSVLDAPAPVIAETTVRPEGRQVPIAFELRYDPKRIDPTRSYAVRVTIRSGDRMMFTTEQVHHVITRGNPNTVELWLVRVAEPTAPTQGLLGTAWRLEDLGGASVLDRVQATLEFPQEGKVAGSGSCNRFFGSVEVSGTSIRFGMVGTTQMACADAVGAQESRYFTALGDAERFSLEGSTLLIFAKGMDKPLRFIRAEP